MTKRLQTLADFFGNYSDRISPENVKGEVLKVFKSCREKLEKAGIDPRSVKLNPLETSGLVLIMNKLFDPSPSPYLSSQDPHRSQEFDPLVENLAQEMADLITEERKGIKRVLRIMDDAVMGFTSFLKDPLRFLTKDEDS